MKNFKSLISVLLGFVLLLNLCACGKSENGAEKNEALPVLPADSSKNDRKANSKHHSGSLYKLETVAAGENEQERLTGVFAGNDEMYTVSVPVESFGGYSIRKNNELIYSSEEICYSSAACEDGIWVLEYTYSGKDEKYKLLHISADGSVLNTIDLSDIARGSYGGQIVLTDTKIFLAGDETQFTAVSKEGEFICTVNKPADKAYLVSGNDGNAYVAAPKGSESDVYKFNTESATLEKVFSTEFGNIFSGGGDNFLLAVNGDGLYSLSGSGQATALALWSECGISLNRVYSLQAVQNGEFLVFDISGISRLVPSSSSEINRKTGIKIATVYPDMLLERAAAGFNRDNPEYYVQIADYSDGGAFAEENAVTKLNTDIISGEFPDMLSFSSLSPYPYMRKGILADLTEFLNSDNEISADDIAILNALDSDGGVYFLSCGFNFETLLGKRSEFGDRYGWTISEYLDKDREKSSGTETIHNMTKEGFADNILSRYIRKAVDWNKGTCSFDSAEFIQLLEAGALIRETPEDPENMVYGFGAAMVGEGKYTAALSWVDSVWKLAKEEQTAGCPISFIGWPTADGSCGTDVHLKSPVGIVKYSKNAEGCREFIKYFLKNTEQDEGVLPVYKPALEKSFENAMSDENCPVKLTNEDKTRFFNLAGSIENVAMYDETVLNIIKEACKPFFDGVKTAEETAATIQSKVSLYLSEQA